MITLKDWVYLLRLPISIAVGIATAWCVKFITLMMESDPNVLESIKYVPHIVGFMWGFIVYLFIEQSFWSDRASDQEQES